MAGEDSFLSRWSRRKSESRDPERAPRPETPAGEDENGAVPARGAAPAPAPVERPPLPPVESLTQDSDFAPFMHAEVDGDVRRQALKTLFSDPRFNTMDMLDVYVDDYSKPDPLPDSWLAKLQQVARLGDRAGRDREEAERRRNSAQIEATDAGPVAASQPDAAVPADPGKPQDLQGNEAEESAAIPSLPSRGSGI